VNKPKEKFGLFTYESIQDFMKKINRKKDPRKVQFLMNYLFMRQRARKHEVLRRNKIVGKIEKELAKTTLRTFHVVARRIANVMNDSSHYQLERDYVSALIKAYSDEYMIETDKLPKSEAFMEELKAIKSKKDLTFNIKKAILDKDWQDHEYFLIRQAFERM
jgi:hypothetical protein